MILWLIMAEFGVYWAEIAQARKNIIMLVQHQVTSALLRLSNSLEDHYTLQSSVADDAHDDNAKRRLIHILF